MHRNTYFLVGILAVAAALIVGVNIGKQLQKPAPPVTLSPTAAATPTPVITAQTYTDTFCGFSLDYPSNFTVLENASGSAILSNAADKTQAITVTCQKTIPRPALPADKIGTLSVTNANGASLSAKLYHDSSAKDGTLIDVVIFRHPTKFMDDFVAGYGSAFDNAIKTIQILP